MSRKIPTCYLCDEVGHVIKECPLKRNLKKHQSSFSKKPLSKVQKDQKGSLRKYQEDSYPETDVASDGNELLNIYDDQPSKLMIIHGTISQVPIRFLIDSGASQNFVSTKVAKKLKAQEAIPGELGDIILADGSEQPCNYFVEGASVQIGAYRNKMNFFVTKLKSFDAVLGKS